MAIDYFGWIGDCLFHNKFGKIVTLENIVNLLFEEHNKEDIVEFYVTNVNYSWFQDISEEIVKKLQSV